MIRFRMSKRVPPNAVNMAYIYSPSFTIEDNLALLDLAHTRPENIAAFGGDAVVDIFTAGLVNTQDLNISSVSVMHPKVGTPIPLYYSYRIGRGTYTLISNDASPLNLAASRPIVRQGIILLDRHDNPLRDIDWDINVVASDGVNGYTVDLYLSRRPRAGETFKIKYDAKAGAIVLPNHIEVINSAPYILQGTDFTLTQQSTGYTITGLTPFNYAPGICFFYRGTNANGAVTISATDVLVLDDLGATHTVSLVGKSIPELVADLNELQLDEYIITPLSESITSRLVLGTYNIYTYGTKINLNQIAHVRYNEETRISVLKPHSNPSCVPWYPRVDPGQFLQDGVIGVTNVKFQFGIPEYANQTWSYTYGQPWRDMAQDLPEAVGDMMLRLNRAPVKDGSLVLYQDGKNVSSKILDVDLLNGIVFLQQRLQGELTADYSYEEKAFVYTGVDLNTNSLHSPNIFGKYIGIYVTPWKILSSDAGIQQTFTGTVRHVVRNTYNEVVDQVDSVLFDDGSDPQAFLLGVFRPVLISDPSDINIVDTRTRGGGITDKISSTDEPESDFYWDIGYYDGEPFQDKGSLVVALPTEMQGTGSPSLRLQIPVDPSGYVTPSGHLTKEYIQGAVDRHIAGGHLALIWPRTGAFVGV